MLGDEWFVRVMRCILAGFTGIDLTFILREIMAPIFLFLLDRLLVPFVFATALGLCVTLSDATSTVIMRVSFLTYFALKLLLVVGRWVKDHITQTHTEMLDSRYLVTELTNQ